MALDKGECILNNMENSVSIMDEHICKRCIVERTRQRHSVVYAFVTVFIFVALFMTCAHLHYRRTHPSEEQYVRMEARLSALEQRMKDICKEGLQAMIAEESSGVIGVQIANNGKAIHHANDRGGVLHDKLVDVETITESENLISHRTLNQNNAMRQSNVEIPTTTYQPSHSRESESTPARLLKREKRGRKGRKKSLTAIQIEGNGGQTTKVEGMWKLGMGVGKSSGTFSAHTINSDGKVKILKSGVYLLYAQITLSGERIVGFTVDRETKNQTMTIASCTHDYKSGHAQTEASVSCNIMKMVKLKRGDRVFVVEMAENTGAVISASLFGLLKM